jgi:hypothetical protein
MPADVYEALDARFAESGLNDLIQGGGFFAGEANPDTPFPYVVMTPIAEAKDVRTNKRNYEDCTLQLAISHQTFKACRDLAKQIKAAVEEAPLVIDDGTVLHCYAGSRTYTFEATFWRANQEVAVKTGHQRPGRAG